MKLMKKMLTLFAVFAVLGTIHTSYERENNAKADSVTNPGDAKRIYSIVVDRFLNGDEGNDDGRDSNDDPNFPFGGDFEGIESQLEYIQTMGFDTLHLSPVFEHETDDYLGYAVTDYNQIEESFGGGEAFQSLIDQAHDMDIEVIVDVPMTATEAFEPLGSADLSVSDLYRSYLDTRGIDMIDFSQSSNQEQYREMLESFTDEYNIDGLSFITAENNIDASTFVPDGVTSYGITTTEDMSLEGFDFTAHEETRAALAESFSSVNKEIPELPDGTEFLLADHWFSERFTSHAVSENMFPGTRIKQLMTYLYAYHGPVSMLYGTEVALNGEDIPGIHMQMDLWTDQEVVEFIEHINKVFSEQKSAFTGDLETILNEDGHYVTRYNTNDVDFILNVNDTSETKSITLTEEEDGKVMSGMLVGDMIRPHNDEYILVLDREETEFYAIVEEMGLNNGYIIASVLIFGGFAVFIFFAARNNKKKRKQAS